jgi:hypothetical protein
MVAISLGSIVAPAAAPARMNSSRTHAINHDGPHGRSDSPATQDPRRPGQRIRPGRIAKLSF